MKNIIMIGAALILFWSATCVAQVKYYRINGGNAVNESSYIESKSKLATFGKVEEFHLKTEVKEDSLITYINLANLITTLNGFDPWGEAKKNIGTRFQIEKFKETNSEQFKSDYVTGKPTFVNFWFTKCPPCISELPTLNKLKEKYGHQINFISITFDSQKDVDKFLKKHDFNFKHITNSKKQIENFNITGFPTSFILDKSGIIKIISPVISDYNVNEIETIFKILL